MWAGFFTRIGGGPRRSLAAIHAARETIEPWEPTVTGHIWSAADPAVNTLVADHGKLYVGGRFRSAAGNDRYALAAFDIATGALSTWNPVTVAPVDALAIGARPVYAGGDFTSQGRAAPVGRRAPSRSP